MNDFVSSRQWHVNADISDVISRRLILYFEQSSEASLNVDAAVSMLTQAWKQSLVPYWKPCDACETLRSCPFSFCRYLRWSVCSSTRALYAASVYLNFPTTWKTTRLKSRRRSLRTTVSLAAVFQTRPTFFSASVSYFRKFLLTFAASIICLLFIFLTVFTILQKFS